MNFLSMLFFFSCLHIDSQSKRGKESVRGRNYATVEFSGFWGHLSREANKRHHCSSVPDGPVSTDRGDLDAKCFDTLTSS